MKENKENKEYKYILVYVEESTPHLYFFKTFKEARAKMLLDMVDVGIDPDLVYVTVEEWNSGVLINTLAGCWVTRPEGGK